MPVPAGVVTEILPVTAVVGTETVMCESSSIVKPGAATLTVPNLTAVAPVNVVPVIWIEVPRTADGGIEAGDLRRHLEGGDARRGGAGGFVSTIGPCARRAGR